jgi:hypothetical protein
MPPPSIFSMTPATLFHFAFAYAALSPFSTLIAFTPAPHYQLPFAFIFSQAFLSIFSLSLLPPLPRYVVW